MTTSAPLLQQATAEIRYDRGVVYLDRCGASMLRVNDRLGTAFVASVPNMNAGELRSEAERVFVRFGIQNLTVTAAWPDNLARFSQLVRDAWSEVAEALEVSRHVTRVGIRIQCLFPYIGASRADALLTNSGVIAETPAWRQMFGLPSTWGMVTHTKSRTYGVRTEVVCGKFEASGIPAPEIVKLLPAPEGEVIMLDLDYYMEKGMFDLPMTPARLADFARLATYEAKRAREALGKALSAKDSGEKDGT